MRFSGLTAFGRLYELKRLLLLPDSSYYDIGEPKKGETIFVTAAAGAVGQLVCQLALHDGLDVIASAGDDEKVKFLIEEVGVKKSFNYKKRDTAEALREFAPNGIDIFYDVSSRVFHVPRAAFA